MVSALNSMIGDMSELPLIPVSMLLPAILGGYLMYCALRLRERAAIAISAVAPLVLVIQISIWMTYYLGPNQSNPGLAGAVNLALVPLLFSWCAIAIAATLVRTSPARTPS